MRLVISVLLISACLVAHGGAADGLCSSPYCPPPWRAFQGHCYLWVDTPMSWMDAERHCQMLSHPGKMVHLTSINSREEDEFVRDCVRKATKGENKPPRSWIGFNDRERENDFKWTDGSDVTYQNWHNREPNNIKDEDCVERNKDPSKWNDLKCDRKLRFVCKM